MRIADRRIAIVNWLPIEDCAQSPINNPNSVNPQSAIPTPQSTVSSAKRSSRYWPSAMTCSSSIQTSQWRVRTSTWVRTSSRRGSGCRRGRRRRCGRPGPFRPAAGCRSSRAARGWCRTPARRPGRCWRRCGSSSRSRAAAPVRCTRADTSRPPRISSTSGWSLELAVLGVEVVAGGPVADERARRPIRAS